MIIRMELPDSTGALQIVLKVEVLRSLFVHESPGAIPHGKCHRNISACFSNEAKPGCQI